MFVSDFLSCLSSANNDEEPIPYLTETSIVGNSSYMSHLDNICQYNYKTNQGLCNLHSFPFTRSQGKLQKVAIPSLFGIDQATAKPSQKPSILRDPPSVIARKRSTALPPIDVSHTAPKKRGCGRHSESPSLHSFNEGDIVYCHFPSKTIISDLRLSS